MANSVRFIHTGDLHLGSAFNSVPGDSTGGKMVLDATYATCASIVDIAIEHSVDFVVFAGDIYDNVKEMFFARNFFITQLERLSAHDIKAYLLYGNHDPQLEHQGSLPDMDNVFEFSAEQATVFEHQFKQGQCTLIGQSFSTSRVRENLAKEYPDAPMGKNSIGVLHTGLTKSTESNYAPCSLEDLAANPFTYWALGHTHNGGVVSEKPLAAYCSSPQALDINETGDHRVWLVELDSGAVVSHTPIPTGNITFAKLPVTISECSTASDAIEVICNTLTKNLNSTASALVVRLQFEGRRAIDLHAWDEFLNQDLAENMALRIENMNRNRNGSIFLDQKYIDNTSSKLNIDELALQNEFIGELVSLAREAENKAEFINQIKSEISTATKALSHTGESATFFELNYDAITEEALELLTYELMGEQ